MTQDEIDTAVRHLELAMANNACLDEIRGHGQSGDCRDIPLRLTAEESRPIFQAMLTALHGTKV